MAKFPKMPLWTDALIGDTYHLTPAEFGAYMRLLIAQWRSKDQKLPLDNISLGRMIGDPNGWHRLKLKVLPFFSITQCGFYRQARCYDEYESTLRYTAQRAAAGTASALKRKNRDATGAQRAVNETLAPSPNPNPSTKEEVSISRKVRSNVHSKNPLNGHQDDFDAFWATYPRRVGKADAVKAYAKALKKADPASILAGCGRYAAIRKGEDATYTAHPTKWLNGECWTDEFPAAEEANPELLRLLKLEKENANV